MHSFLESLLSDHSEVHTLTSGGLLGLAGLPNNLLSVLNAWKLVPCDK